MAFHGWRREPFITTLESHPLSFSPYMLLIIECQSESCSNGNLQSHFSIRVWFLNTKFLILTPLFLRFDHLTPSSKMILFIFREPFPSSLLSFFSFLTAIFWGFKKSKGKTWEYYPRPSESRLASCL